MVWKLYSDDALSTIAFAVSLKNLSLLLNLFTAVMGFSLRYRPVI
jgi:hypothetical protein